MSGTLFPRSRLSSNHVAAPVAQLQLNLVIHKVVSLYRYLCYLANVVKVKMNYLFYRYYFFYFCSFLFFLCFKFFSIRYYTQEQRKSKFN